MKKSLLLSVLLAAGTMIAVSGNFGNEQALPAECSAVLNGQDDTGIRADITGGKIVLLTPIVEKIKFDVLERTSAKIKTKITGVEDFIVDTKDEMFIVKGGIEYIIVEQFIDGGSVGPAFLLEIKGNYTTTPVSGRTIMEWSRLLDEGHDCEEDEDCEHLPPWVGYVIKCVDGYCRYIPNNDLQNEI